MFNLPQPLEKKTKRGLLILLTLSLVLQIIVLFTYPSPRLVVSIFDVGAGDSILIQTSDGHTVLIDGGPDDSVIYQLGKTLPFWVREIDLVVVTHWHADHFAGLIDILEKYNVKNILVGDLDCDERLCERLLQSIEDEKPVILRSEPGARVVLGETNLTVLWPPPECYFDKNDCSVTLTLDYGDFGGLFTGDLEEAGQRAILDSLTGVELFKVPHHGADCLWELFLNKIAPLVSVISVGDNHFGHPTQATLEKLRESGSKMLRTDQDGTVKIISDGERWEVRNWDSKKLNSK